MDPKEINLYFNLISMLRRERIFNGDDYYYFARYLENKRHQYKNQREYIYQKPRREAQKFISNKKIRKQVFDIHGKICLCCGSLENISLDHIKPVYKGGLNKIENLQPLCRSCNSRKSTNTIDYRINGKRKY